MSAQADGDGRRVPSLDGVFSREEVSVDLTMCGLLVDRAEHLARLYATHRDWTQVEEAWFDQRMDGRSTEGSSRKIYRVLSSRFKTVGSELPAISKLPAIFDQCETHRDKAQVLYFYLVEDDTLVKYVLHQYVRRFVDGSLAGIDFHAESVQETLQSFHYADGTEFDYAESTATRWGEGLRSVMREIGVLETQQSFEPTSPTVGTVPLLVSAGYSWQTDGEEWLSAPVGWLYLFQPEQYWESLAERLADHEAWTASGIHGTLRLEPSGDPFGWADEREGEP